MDASGARAAVVGAMMGLVASCNEPFEVTEAEGSASEAVESSATAPSSASGPGPSGGPPGNCSCLCMDYLLNVIF